MVIETTIICLDNSEYSRNGDYLPSRLDMQRECSIEVCGAKHRDNPENALALLSAAGDRVTVCVTPTQDIGRILEGLHEIEPNGFIDIIKAIQVAQLALKHRMHKHHSQRIIIFVGSPINASEKALENLGRSLKKNNIYLDIVSFGETNINHESLQVLHNSVGSRSTFVELPPEQASELMFHFLKSPVIDSKRDYEEFNEENPTLQREILRQIQQDRGQNYDGEDEEVAEAILMSLSDYCDENLRLVHQSANLQVASQEILGAGDAAIAPVVHIPDILPEVYSKSDAGQIIDKPPNVKNITEQIFEGISGIDTDNIALQEAVKQLIDEAQSSNVEDSKNEKEKNKEVVESEENKIEEIAKEKETTDSKTIQNTSQTVKTSKEHEKGTEDKNNNDNSSESNKQEDINMST